MFRDIDGNELTIGDRVTVVRSSRHTFAGRSHGVAEKFGTKLVHVRLTHARSQLDDNSLKGFDPDELRMGHHGRPRHPEGFVGEMREQLTEFQNDQLNKLIAMSIERGVINDEQAEVMRLLMKELE